MPIKLARVVPGQILTDSIINETSEAVERSQINIGPNSTLGMSRSPTSTIIWSIEGRLDIWAKITSGGNGSTTGTTSGAYAWIEQFPGINGTWMDGFRKGTPITYPAFESNNNGQVADGKIVRMTFAEASRTFLFTYAPCSA